MFFQLKLKKVVDEVKGGVFLNRGYIEKIIHDMISETRIKYVRPVNIIEQYVVDDVIQVFINNRNGELEYIVSEPEYDENTVYVVSKLYLENPRCKDLVCIEKTISKVNDRGIQEIFSQQPLNIMYYYLKIASGYGALYPLVRDPYIEEIAVSSDDRNIGIIHRKYSWYGWINTNIMVSGEIVDRMVLSLARKIGRHLSISHPIAEGLTSEGMRISLTYGREVSRKGSSLVIRKKPPTPWTITKLIDVGTLSPLIAAYLWLVMEFRGSILIVGGVSSGKTTLLQALLTLVPPTRRVVTIEDTPEILGSTGYWDPLVERVVSIGDSLNIDMYSLLKFSLRRRADYLVVGEVRGVEARLLVQASRLGHGVLATLHSEDAVSAIERLTSPPISIPKKLLSNIWCIVVMESDNGVRRVKSVYELDEKVKLHQVFRYSRVDDFKPHDIPGLINSTYRLKQVLDEDDLSNELLSRIEFLGRLVSNGVFDLNSLSESLINFYYKLVEEEVLKSNAE